MSDDDMRRSSDIVERIARALCDDTLKRWRSPIGLNAEAWKEFIPAAKSVLSVLKYPDSRMLESGVDAYIHGGESIPSRVRSSYVAMINAALFSNPNPLI